MPLSLFQIFQTMTQSADCDVLIIGSGAAGLSLALELANHAKITLNIKISPRRRLHSIFNFALVYVAIVNPSVIFFDDFWFFNKSPSQNSP